MPLSLPALAVLGKSSAPAAVVAHGAGSTADFVLRAFGPAVTGAGLRLVSWDCFDGDVDAELAAVVAATGARVVGGVSRGAHAAAVFASGRDLDGLLLALPAWTGPPGEVAALSASAAVEVCRDGLAARVGTLGTDGWVGRELAAAWTAYGESRLVRALERVSRSAGPSLRQLHDVAAPAGVVGLTGDPFHPAQVAREWAAELPVAELRLLAADAPQGDRGVLGAAAVAAWRQAAAAGVSGSR